MGVGGDGLVRAGQLVLVVAALFEPIRLAVQPFVGDEVGGVGGWGGLTNIGVPEDCEGASGRGEGWCFKPGVLLGLSPFGLAFVAAWALPSLIAAALRAAGVKVGAQARGADAAHSAAEGQNADDAKLGRLLRAWNAISVLWFVVPLASFVFDPFYRANFWTGVLGLSLIAAYPLSWHLALVALPVSELVAPHLSLSEQAAKTFHKSLGWRTAGWAAMHGGLELVYVTYKGLPEHLNVVRHPENWMYLLGLVTLVLMAVHCLVALFRRQEWLRARFRAVHGIIALALLACATAHWPPFALLMVPASAAHGGGAAKRLARRAGVAQPAERRDLMATALALAGGLAGLSAAWVARERALGRPNPDARLQHAFAVSALLAEFVGGLAGAAVVLALPTGAASPRDEPLTNGTAA